MRILTGLVLLLGAALLQTTLIARVTLLQGSADLVLLILVTWMLQPGAEPDWKWGIPAGLMVGYATALPDWVMWVGYVAVAAIAQWLRLRLWQGRLLPLFSSVLLGTLAIHAVTLLYLFLSAYPIDALEAINLITIPSLLLNLIFVLPVNAIIGELNKLVSPIEEPA